MPYANITGWGKCVPPSVLSNEDLTQIFDTSDEWIAARTGIRERRICDGTNLEMGVVAARHALACSGIGAAELDCII